MSAPLADQPWLIAAPTRAVMAALTAAGGPDAARFVGGCVRNALLGAPVADVDIATRLKPEAVVEALKAAGLKAVPTGLAHGTVTAVAHRQPFEITTLRRDVTTDGRRATVAFTDDWAEDAGRRDFRLNALYADVNGAITDPTGEGVADALTGRIVFVGDPERRIREDYLRILRFFRFFAWYGRGEADAAGLAACAALADGVATLSAERVSKELLTLLAAPDPRRAVRLMAQVGVLAVAAPDALELDRFERMIDLSPDPVLRLAALLTDEASASGKAAGALRLSRAMRDRLMAATGPGPDVTPDIGERAGRAALYRLGREPFEDRLRLALASGAAARGADALLAQAQTWPIPRLPVGGAMLAKRDVPPGPAVGELLKAFEEGWIAEDFPAEGHAARLDALVRAWRARNG